MYDYLDLRQTEKLKELVPYKALAPDADEIIKELERLNNIINELEKYLEEFDFTVFICCNRKASKSIELGARLNNDFILDKLKELKDSDNNVKKINTNNN